MKSADDMSQTALDRFIRYVQIDTQSQEDCAASPTTQKQLDLLGLLRDELHEIGASDARMDEHGYVMATIPSALPAERSTTLPTIGLIAHVDTSPSFTGAHVKPQLVRYMGGDVVLPGDPSVVIRAAENPELERNLGKTIVTADGTTLLGADDKAGVAIIMTVAETLLATPSIPHPAVRIAFTPDEEVGKGTEFFDLQAFGAAYAYTVDGGTAGELNRETFSADSAVVTVVGRNIHPGDAKGTMVNSLRAISEVVVRMPKHLAPEATALRQPFLHPNRLVAEEARSRLKILLRDFETDGLKEQAQTLKAILAEVQELYPRARFELSITESYRNMRDVLERHPRVTEVLWEATQRAGLQPKWVPIRGGTDGARLTAKGLPTPNIFTGGHNYHGPTEWLSVEGMNQSVETVLHLLQIWAESP
jgi:tripeptide aminopeptidase